MGTGRPATAQQWADSRGWYGAPRLEVVFDLLSSRPPGRLVDLGAGHGKFSVLAHDLGWQVTAIDGRGDRFPRDRFPEIDWVVADVREVTIDDDVDLVLNLGLLYHLELDDQLALLRTCSVAPTLVDTHAAVNAHVEVDGWQGAWFDENLEKSTASIGNRRSFWPIEPELVRQFRESGFGAIWRLTPESQVGRTMWFCLPAAPDSSLLSTPPEPSRHELGAEGRQQLDALRQQAEDLQARLARSEQEHAELRRRWDRLNRHPVMRVARGAQRLGSRRR